MKNTHNIGAVLVGDDPKDFDSWYFTEPQQDKDSKFESDIMTELRNSILNEKDPVQRQLGLYELENPSVQRYEGIQHRATMIKELGELVKYDAIVTNDRIGTDFMTNQPKYKTRETIVA
ncbi:MAG: hypothetical protein PVJ67_06990 [Candidatus Pacearchaeota archaeon]|jgi:hypothetical protein